METKIGKEVAHVTRGSDTSFNVKRSKVNLQGAGHIVAASRTAYGRSVSSTDMKRVRNDDPVSLTLDLLNPKSTQPGHPSVAQ